MTTVQKHIKNLTIHWVTYLNLSAEERKAYNEQLKNEKPILENRAYYSHKWFGLLPMMLRRLFNVSNR